MWCFRSFRLLNLLSFEKVLQQNYLLSLYFKYLAVELGFKFPFEDHSPELSQNFIVPADRGFVTSVLHGLYAS